MRAVAGKRMRGRFRRHGSLHDDQRQLAAQRSVVRAAVSRPCLARPPLPARAACCCKQGAHAPAAARPSVSTPPAQQGGGYCAGCCARPAVAALQRALVPTAPCALRCASPSPHVAPVPSAAAEAERETYAEEVVAGVLAVKVSLAVSLDVGDVELLELADRGEHCRCGTYFRPGPG